MNGEISIDADALQAHISQVQDVVADIDRALQAVAYTQLNSLAFGLMCSFAALPTSVVGAAAAASMAATGSLLDRSAAVVNAGIADFADFEQRTVAQLRELASGVDGERVWHV